MIVSTSRRGRDVEIARAHELAATWGLTYVPRAELPHDARFLAVTRDGLRLELDRKPRAWHPAMLHAMRETGARHPLIRLTGATRGDTVVDCTLGLGTDARFLSEWCGTRVIGLEVSPAVAAWTAEGLAGVGADVEVVLTDAASWLARQPSKSVDVVMADPMFPERPSGTAGNSLDPVRWLGDHRPLDLAWRDEALRVARKAVIVRTLWADDLLERLGAPIRDGKKTRITWYGCWRSDA
jgi:hypothetical protein